MNTDLSADASGSESSIRLDLDPDVVALQQLHGACNVRDRYLTPDLEKPANPANTAKPRKPRKPAPDWFEKCKGTSFIFELCCLGKTYRNAPGRPNPEIVDPITVDECIWGTFYPSLHCCVNRNLCRHLDSQLLTYISPQS